MHRSLVIAISVTSVLLVRSITDLRAEVSDLTAKTSNGLEQADAVVLVEAVTDQLNAAGQAYYEESLTNRAAETPAIIAASFGSGSNFIEVVESERQSAISERRAFGIHGTNILLLGINIATRWIPTTNGLARIATRVSDAGSTGLHAGDLIIECDGIPLEPGQDLPILVNANGPGSIQHRLAVIRDGVEIQVDLDARITSMTESQIAERRRRDAVETVVLRRFARGGVKRPALDAWETIVNEANYLLKAVRNSLEASYIIARLAESFHDKAQYTKAAEYYQQALAIKEKKLSSNDTSLARSLTDLGNVLFSQGDYSKSETYHTRALVILEESLGKDHPHVAISLNNLANVYLEQGDYAKAEEYYTRALAITETWPNTSDLDHAKSLIGLGSMYFSLGDNAKANEHFQHGLAMLETTYGDSHYKLADFLDIVGTKYSLQGDLQQAEEYLVRALSIREETPVVDNLELASSFISLGHMYSYHCATRAEEYFVRALNILEKNNHFEHPYMEIALAGLGSVYFEEGDYDRATQYHTRALDLTEASHRRKSARMVLGLRGFGTTYYLRSDFAKAERYFSRALDAREKALGTEHPDLISSLNDFTLVSYIHTGVSVANNILPLLERAMIIEQATAENIFSFSSERQRLMFMDARLDDRPRMLMCTLAKHGDKPARDSACLWTLRTKGAVLDSILEDRQNLSGNTNAIPVFDELREVEGRRANLQFRDIRNMTEHELEAQSTILRELNERKDTLERDLARLAPRYREGRRAANVTIEQVQGALAANEALVEFVAFYPVATAEDIKAGLKTLVESLFSLLDATVEKVKARWIPTHEQPFFPREYAAFVIKSDAEHPEMISIGDADEIDELIDIYTEKMQKGGEVENKLKELYEKVWAPLEDSIGEKSRIIISPEGELNFLAFGALLGPDGDYLIERYTIGYVTSGRDLVRRFEDVYTTGPVLFGDPDYGLWDVEDDELNWLARGDASSLAPSRIGETERAMYLRHTLRRLPGTREEVKGIQRMLEDQGPTVYLDCAAREEKLKSVVRPGILHLATHGFFFENVATPTNQTQRMIMWMDDIRSRPVLRGNPMHRSGLALAGANLALQGRTAPEGVDDGIVTAEEVGGLDLWGTELVALSACVTARGEAHAGEGVMGLRRAFVQAGARNLMLTMWIVEDQFTRDLILAFYDDFLETGDATGAITRVQRAALAKAKEQNETLHPRFWAPFLISIQGSSKHH